MWWELALDLLWPSREPKRVEQALDRGPGGTLPVQVASAGAFRRSLNESGWLADEVVAAGMLQQGSPPSLAALLTGAALLQMARRPSKSLPREFALALTADRVIAFAMSPWKEGEAVSDSVAVVKIKPGELASWPRESVHLTDLHKRVGTTGGTLHRPGVEPFPVTCEGDPSTEELIEHLSR
jgi:hypothetical protein